MAQKTILAIDTSGPLLQLCLKTAGKNHVFSTAMPKGHAEKLFGQIADLLQQNYIKYANITRIGVTVGPGSFTGLRIGIAAARGLALALKIPVIGIPNLFALSLSHPKKPFYIIVDARREQFYVQHFTGPCLPDSDPQLLGFSQVEFIKSDAGNKIFSDSKVDIGLLADFALGADPEAFPPLPTYIRPADAKVQTKKLIARQFVSDNIAPANSGT